MPSTYYPRTRPCAALQSTSLHCKSCAGFVLPRHHLPFQQKLLLAASLVVVSRPCAGAGLRGAALHLDKSFVGFEVASMATGDFDALCAAARAKLLSSDSPNHLVVEERINASGSLGAAASVAAGTLFEHAVQPSGSIQDRLRRVGELMDSNGDFKLSIEEMRSFARSLKDRQRLATASSWLRWTSTEHRRRWQVGAS